MKKVFEKTYIKRILIFIMSIISLIPLFVNVSLTKSNNFKLSFKVEYLTLTLICFLIYKLYINFYLDKKPKCFKLISLMFSIFMVIGNSYDKYNNWNLIFGSLLLFSISFVFVVGYYFLFNYIINKIYYYVINNDVFKNKNIKIKKIIEFVFIKHPFISCFIIMLICWLPYIISFYPGILSPDPSNQIKQFFGLDVQYKEYVVLLDPNVTITNHHPFLHTILLGGCVWIGRLLGSDNLGIFIYSIIQIISLLSILSYTITYMKKMKTPMWIRVATLLIYSFVPVFPLYAMSTVKDVLFGVLTILYAIKLFDCIKYSNTKIYSLKNILILIIIMLLTMMMRNNGIYMILMSFPFLVIIDKKNRKKILLTLFIPIIIFKCYTNILLPTLKITPGSIREMLSIPFQQTARYVKEYGNEVNNEEKKVIDNVLGYDDLVTRYDPLKADPVKNEYNKYTTKKELKDYFKVWFNGLLKHPNVYFEATFNNVFGYFYPNDTNWYIYHKYDSRLNDTGQFDYHYNNLNLSRKMLSSYAIAFPYIPVLGLIVNIGFSVWIIITIFTFIIHLKKYKYLIYLTPYISLILVCVASPVNTYFRYALPYVFAIPLIIAMFINILNEKEGSNKNEKENSSINTML